MWIVYILILYGICCILNNQVQGKIIVSSKFNCLEMRNLSGGTVDRETFQQVLKYHWFTYHAPYGP